jgi:lysine-specific histone demethylase 1
MRGAERIVDPAAGGYTALVNLLRDRIANSASRCALQTASQVARIVLDSPQGGVRVDLANGRSLAAAFVVCTLPLGVLKGQAVAFSPPLPARKQAAVRRLGVGLLDKVVLVYSRQFWAKLSGGDEGWLQLVFPEQPPPGSWAADGTALEFWNGAKFGLSAGSGAGHAAVALLLGASTAEAWERQPDSVLVARADALFRSLWPSSAAGGAAGAAPRLVESLVTRWRSDRFANGSYSYLPPGARPADRRELCAAQADKLFWAGEHCSINHPATAHGAYESGLAAARAAAAARPRAVAAMSAEAAAALRPRPADGAAGQPSAVRALLPCALMAFAVAAAVGVRRRLRADRVNQQCHEMAQLDGHSRK